MTIRRVNRTTKEAQSAGRDEGILFKGEVKQGGEEEDDDEEDAFCRRMLLLGATWWDGEKRHQFIDNWSVDVEHCVDDVEKGRVAAPTLRERRWVKVGIDERKGGGLWILDCDRNWTGIIEPDNMVPADAARVKLATTMEERCEILRNMGATFYSSLEDYGGNDDNATTFLSAWEWKRTGEVGELG